jgi:hypothetical protein
VSTIFGGGGSSVQQPNLKTENLQSAQGIVLGQDISQYAQSDADWAARFPGLASGRSAMINDLGTEMQGKLPAVTTSTLNTAGLGDEAKAIQGKNEFQTSRNLGQPILAKEQRDRNYAASLLAMNPPRQLGLSGQDVLDIVTANTGNVNAYRQAINTTQQNAAATATLQQGQDISALGSLLTAGAKVGASAYSDPYTSPFSSIYNPSPYSYIGAPSGSLDWSQEDPAFTAMATGG